MVAIAPGMFLAHSVVPSSGSTAISTNGPALSPTFSPMNSIGASSRSPSPITTVPWIGSLLSSRRMASTAAWSAAFSLPWPRSRAADTAARSVTRTSSSVRMRSSNSCGGTEIWVDIGVLLKSSWRRAIRLDRASILLDPYHLRPANDHLVFLHGGERPMHGIFMRGVGDQDDRHRRSIFCRAPDVRAVGMALHDRFQRNLLLGKPCGDGGCRAGEVARHQADVIAAFMTLHRRLIGVAQLVHRSTERHRANAARHVGNIGEHGRRGCGAAGA